MQFTWNYDTNGIANGICRHNEMVELGKSSNSYRGTLIVDVYDLNDTLLFEDTGEMTGATSLPLMTRTNDGLGDFCAFCVDRRDPPPALAP